MITVNRFPKPNKSMRWKTDVTPSTKSRPRSRPSVNKPCPLWSSPSSRTPRNAEWRQRKKHNLRRKGVATIQIKTLHGVFAFAEQRLLLSDGSEHRYLAYTEQEPVSVGLQEFSLYFCNRLSFAEVEKLLLRLTGTSIVCAQTLWNWVEARAASLDTQVSAQVLASGALPALTYGAPVDLYDKGSAEVLVLTDAIGVKAQKPTRDKPGASKTGKVAKRHDTDVFLLQRPGGDFLYLAGSTDRKVSLTQVAEAYLRAEWGGHETPLPVVAITDGACSIRSDLTLLFGEQVTIILDWYHLRQRVCQHLSMCAHSKPEREGWEQAMLKFLWHGQVSEARAFLSEQTVRNSVAQTELLGYLDKHASEIIDYERRKQTGRPIGSGRMEKAVDQVIGMRQKKKGMSWSARGSRALAALKMAELNGVWNQLFPNLSMTT
jgi:hypothetical protein